MSLFKWIYWILLIYDLSKSALSSSSSDTYQLCSQVPIGGTPAPHHHDDQADSAPLEFLHLIPNQKMYDKMKPPKQAGQPTKVEFHVTVMGLDSINEYSMTYAADIFVSQTWKDYRLRLPENMTQDYRLLEVSWLQQMWRPDSFFKNAKQVTFQTMTVPNHYLWLYKSTAILYMVKLTLTLSCSMNFALYPHDTQELSHTTDDLVFEWEKKVPLAVDKIELPQLQLVESRTEDCTQVYSTGNFTCLEVIFVLKRRLGYYLFHTYIPTCLIVIMSWISFWIAPEAAPARVTLGVTSLLTLSTQHAKSQASLPPVSYLKAVDLFMSACTLFVFLALMEYCLVNIVLGDAYDKKTLGSRRFSKGSRVFQLSKKFPRLLSTSSTLDDPPCMMSLDFGEQIIHIPPAPPPPKARNPSPPPSNAPGSNCITAEKRMKALAVDKYSRIIFPLSFTILNCIYWIRFMEYL